MRTGTIASVIRFITPIESKYINQLHPQSTNFNPTSGEHESKSGLSITTYKKMSSGIHLIIIGAGLAGLSAAISTKLANPNHKVIVLESSKELGDIGAGLQLTPNAARLFKPWGIHDQLVSKATVPQSLTIHRFDGSKSLLHYRDFQSGIGTRYGAPVWGLHRVDLHHVMAARCVELGVTLLFDAKVSNVDFVDCEVRVERTGEWIGGDVILCAEGLWSVSRSLFLGRLGRLERSGEVAVRVVVRREEIIGEGEEKKEMREFIERRGVDYWVGEGRYVVSHAMRGEEVFNLVFYFHESRLADISHAGDPLEEIKQVFKDWDPLLGKFLEKVKEVKKWQLMQLDDIKDWCNSEGNFWMAGDAVHPLPPYLSQGANSSLEDGAVIGYLLSKVEKERKDEQLPRAARMFRDLRRERGEMIRKESLRAKKVFQLGDGEEQERRDARMKIVDVDVDQMGDEEARERELGIGWIEGKLQDWLFGYDAYKEVEEAFERDPF